LGDAQLANVGGLRGTAKVVIEDVLHLAGDGLVKLGPVDIKRHGPVTERSVTDAHPISAYKANLKQTLLAGGLAGTAVDTALFPLDTLKTRLQSQAGLVASGGFRGIYSGLLSAVIGSAPNASLFFVTYEFSKRVLSASFNTPKYDSLIHMAAASFGEIVRSACVVRVPTEVIKQRMQTKQYSTTSAAVSAVIRGEGILGFYHGYLSTVAREIPFTCIQFPLYEYLKRQYARIKRDRIEPYEAAMCGSLAGGVAAAITTPLDVCKTRIMLSSKQQTNIQHYTGTVSAFRRILAEEGARGLFAGIGPRVLWISIGGSIFLGVYEKAVKTMVQTGLLADRR
ncbi:hypothetical protein BC936DRAFT_138741, partial [Jimgerdemannia flammicorona]